MKGSRRYIAAAFLACAVSIAAGYVIPQIIRFTVDCVFGSEAYPRYLAGLPVRQFFADNLYVLALAVGLFALVQGAGSYFYRAGSLRAGEKMSKRMKDGLFSHIQSLPFSWHTSVQTGDIIQRATQDADLIKRFVADQLTELLRIAAMIIAGLAIMFVMDPLLALVTVAFIPLIIIFSAVYFNRISRSFQAADEAEGALTAALQENLTGVRVVRAFGAQKRETLKFKEKNDTLYSMWIRVGKHLSVFWASGDLFSALQVLCVLVTGVFFTASGRITAGDLIAFIFYNQMIVWPVRNMGRILGEISKTGISTGRINEILTAKPEADAVVTFKPVIKGAVAFKNVVFSYGANKVLDNVSFEIGAGKTLGILGGTGSGKSTIAHLINGLYAPQGGEVCIDGINAGGIEKAYLRRNVGLILQEPFLFSRTVAGNIAVASPGSPLSEIREYAGIAGVDDSVTGFEKGYETMVGERGVTLSGGQKQRIAIARTLIGRPPVLIFDDSLSAVDTVTDAEIRRALREKVRGATLILISHRITTLMNADKIIVLKDGRVADSGTHRELIKREGLYKKIYDIQIDAGLME